MRITNSEQIKDNLKTILALEYLGIHIEDVIEKDQKQLYYFSVPENSLIEDEEHEGVNTAEGLIKVAKEALIQLIINSCKATFDDIEEDNEFYQELEQTISSYAQFFAKVRYGETWNKEMGQAAIKQVTESINGCHYVEV